MRKGGVLTYMLTDHPSITSGHRLGSTSLITNATGAVLSETRYTAWGEVRYQAGSEGTKYQFTGQFSYASDFGLLYYGSRFYDPQLGRFSSADSIIPESQGAQAYDRYAYVNNNPIRYTDPSGHCAVVCAAAIVITAATVAGAVGGALGYAAYIQFSGEEFDSTSFWVSTVGGGVTSGAATFGFIASGFNPGVFLAVMGAGNAVQYAVDRKLHNDPINILKLEDDIMLTTEFRIGVVGGAIGGTTSSNFLNGSSKKIAIEFGRQTYTRFGKEAGKRFLAELTEETAVSAGRGGTATTFTSFINRIFNKDQFSIEREKE